MMNPRITMRPRVVTAADVRSNPALTEDSYFGKVSRYIPGEIVTAYMAASQLIIGAQGLSEKTQLILLWVTIGLLGILTPVWILYATAIPGRPKAVFQAVMATLAFAFWVFALSGAVIFSEWYNPVYGGLSLIFFTLVVPLLEKIFIK